MENLKEKVQSLGYKEIKDIDSNTFLGSSKGSSAYVKKLEEGIELKPNLIPTITYAAIEINTKYTKIIL